MSHVTRFAPSPTGPLHLGHAYSALIAYDRAKAQGGKFLLRIEDIDRQRSKPEWEALIYEDLHWLGISWEEPTMRQSDRLAEYRAALDDLWARGALYLCHCSRRDIEAALSAPQETMEPTSGPDGPIYPGTCRDLRDFLPHQTRPDGALRLRMGDVENDYFGQHDAPHHASFVETGFGPGGETGQICYGDFAKTLGDIVLSRRDFLGSYHLSVVLDDAAQGITEVVRGQDLFEATKIHVILQWLMGLPTPSYHHHRLIRDQAGKRLAKRDDARAIRQYRADGASPDDIRRMVGL